MLLSFSILVIFAATGAVINSRRARFNANKARKLLAASKLQTAASRTTRKDQACKRALEFR